tara:strand:- start:26 stop:664 length:639 start_codon:yes stop_codon:yes gene_type:complete
MDGRYFPGLDPDAYTEAGVLDPALESLAQEQEMLNAVVLGPNSSKADIQNWQRFLARKGQSLGHWCVDGDWGKKQNSFTRNGTRAVAQMVGLSTPDGVVTTALWNAVRNDPDISDTPLTSSQRQAACPPKPRKGGGGSTPQVAATGSAPDDYSTPGASMAGMFKGRNIALIGGVALLGFGLFAMMRRRGAVGQGAIVEAGPGASIWESIEVY